MMINEAIAFLEITVLPLGAPGVFVASIIEEIIAIIPSSVVQMGAGFLFLEGAHLSFDALVTLALYVVLPASLGVMVGSLPIYYAAYYGGKPLIKQFGKYVSVSWADIEKAQERFEKSKREELFIFICRALPVMPSVVITTFSGVVRIRLHTYLLYTFLGTCVRATILGVIGWQLGALYHTYAEYVDRLEKIGLVVLVVLSVVYYVVHHRAQKQHTSAA